MKKFALNLGLLLAAAHAFGQSGGDSSPVGEKKPDDIPSYWSIHPLQAYADGIYIASASMDSPDTGNVQFAKVNGSLEILVPVTYQTYFFPRVTWNTIYLNWDENPRFNQHTFDNLQFSLVLYTTEIESWRWIGRFDYHIDPHHFNEASLYSLFTGLLWGSYTINEKWHYHVGGFGYGGMEGSTIYPIIGFDYAPTPKWLIQLIFPIDYSVQYNFTPRLRLSGKIRPLKERWRTDQYQPSPRSIFSYTSTGFEANLHYEIQRRLTVEVFGGYNFGGNLYIKDQQGKNALYTDFGGAPYGGITLNVGF